MKKALGPGEAARRLGVSTRTVQRWLREGRLPAVAVGSRLKVDAAALPPGPGFPPAAPPADVTLSAPAGKRSGRPIGRLLAANRGELVVRIARTCRRLGIRCLALAPEDQSGAWWTTAADEVVPLDGTYLDLEAVMTAARAAGVDAVHPGYGFLAENPNFAEAVLDAGMAWLGPPPTSMRALGEKAAARQLARRLGVPTLAGYDGTDQSDERLRAEALRIGLPLLVKPSAGGGGKGMHVVHREAELPDALALARREASAAFGDERLILERYLFRPRHVEVQLLCDGHGAAIHLGERECSLQRRHQKVIEESPSPAVDAALRAQLGEAALALARAADYEGVGTAEFLLADDGSFYFLELNARLQVEHPVTELVSGRDLVADQLAIAAGEPLSVQQSDVVLRGHAIEARLYAEDPDAGFLPASGEILDVEWPDGEGLRIDAGVGPGDAVGTRYDPLLAKLIVHGSDRQQALQRLEAAVRSTSVIGVTTNRGFLAWLLQLPQVRDRATHTQLIDECWEPDESLPEAAWQHAAVALAEHQTSAARPTNVAPGFRVNAASRLRIELDGQVRSEQLPDEPPTDLRWRAAADDARSVVLDMDGRALRARLAPPPTVEAAVRQAEHAGTGGQVVAASMPGSVLAVHVAEGDEVEAGQLLLVLEAMKMENAVSAPAAGRVARVLTSVGKQVARGEPLIELS